MSPFEIKEILISRTIEVIANEGLDKTTTKAITAGTGINEAYIYRYFSNKEGLLAATFEKLDAALARECEKNIEIMYMNELDFETRCRFYFDKIWQFILNNKEACLAFIRYYYSPYFTKYSVRGHEKRHENLVTKFKIAFKDEANVWLILKHILNVMHAFAVMVYTEQMPNQDDYTEHVFRVIYESIKQYFRE